MPYNESFYFQAHDQMEHELKKKKKRCRSKSLVRSRKRRQRQNQGGCSNQSTSEEIHETHRYRHPPPSLFETYIRRQGHLTEYDLHHLFSTIRQPLPICFRIRSEKANREWEGIRKNKLDSATKVAADDNAWQISSRVLDEHPQIRRWVIAATANGDISRQEYVSMIPVLLLNVQSNHRVLDMCASPGSKTIQALDSIYSKVRDNECYPTGFIIANELNSKRAYVLAHRTRETLRERMVSMAIVTHNACKFPNILAPCRRSTALKNQDQSETTCPFDRIICDVPCSGDGTLRKDFKVWKTWHPSYGIELHSLQLRIAKRGIALLRIGGYITYSTCSFHPIENEAVVAALLATGCVELATDKEIEERMGRNIVYREGLTSWKVLDDECQQVSIENKPGHWPKSLWPPTCGETANALKRCIRMVPHDNDTGGFFIALLKKVKEFDEHSKKNVGQVSIARKEPMVTPQAPFHQLRPLKLSTTKDCENSRFRFFSRSPSSNNCGSVFKISTSLASYLHDRPGSSKLNLVYAGLATSTQPSQHLFNVHKYSE